MRFHLNYSPKPSSFKIDHQHKIMLVGSCFSENIGDTLLKHHYNVFENPNGILYNPLSISQCIDQIIENDERVHSGLLERNGLQFSFLHHSSISHPDKDHLRKELREQQKRAHDFLKEADLLIITFGSAFAYMHKELKMIVANCHKMPSEVFNKELLTIDEIVSAFSALLSKLKAFNTKLKFIFTVSPVKYLRDGIEENSISKSTLLLAIHELKKKFSIDYFPAYELVIDDLRDHRFYKKDLAHPNKLAIEYVWQKFSETYFTEETRKLNSDLNSINLSEDHKILFPGTEEAIKFKESIETKKGELKTRFPFLKF